MALKANQIEALRGPTMTWEECMLEPKELNHNLNHFIEAVEAQEARQSAEDQAQDFNQWQVDRNNGNVLQCKRAGGNHNDKISQRPIIPKSNNNKRKVRTKLRKK